MPSPMTIIPKDSLELADKLLIVANRLLGDLVADSHEKTEIRNLITQSRSLLNSTDNS